MKITEKGQNTQNPKRNGPKATWDANGDDDDGESCYGHATVKKQLKEKLLGDSSVGMIKFFTRFGKKQSAGNERKTKPEVSITPKLAAVCQQA